MLHENSDSRCNKKMMIQVISEPIKQSALLVMVITNKEERWVKPKADGRNEEFNMTRWTAELLCTSRDCFAQSHRTARLVVKVLTPSS